MRAVFLVVFITGCGSAPFAETGLGFGSTARTYGRRDKDTPNESPAVILATGLHWNATERTAVGVDGSVLWFDDPLTTTQRGRPTLASHARFRHSLPIDTDLAVDLRVGFGTAFVHEAYGLGSVGWAWRTGLGLTAISGEQRFTFAFDYHDLAIWPIRGLLGRDFNLPGTVLMGHSATFLTVGLEVP